MIVEIAKWLLIACCLIGGFAMSTVIIMTDMEKGVPRVFALGVSWTGLVCLALLLGLQP